MKFEPEEIEAIAAGVVRGIMPRIIALEESIRKLTAHFETSHKNLPPPNRPTVPVSTVVRGRELKALTGLSSTTLWRLEKQGLFPKRITLSTNRVGWLRIDVERWLEQKRKKD